MGAGLPALCVAYLLPALLAAGVVLRSSWSAPLKASSIAVATALYAATGLSLPPLLGWPTPDAPPATFRLVAARIQQPDKATHDPGAVYLWVTDAGDLAGAPEPRAYRLAYSAPLHEAVTNAAAKLQTGTPQIGEFARPDAGAFAVADGATRAAPETSPLRFYDMPDPLFPDK